VLGEPNSVHNFLTRSAFTSFLLHHSEDSFDLYYGLYRYNYNSKSEIQRLEDSLRDLRMKLEEEERNDQDQ